MSHIQSAMVDERGSFMRRQHPAPKACVCQGWGGGKGMRAGRDTICSPKGLSAAPNCLAFKSCTLGRFKSANKTTMLSQ